MRVKERFNIELNQQQIYEIERGIQYGNVEPFRKTRNRFDNEGLIYRVKIKGKILYVLYDVNRNKLATVYNHYLMDKNKLFENN